MPTINELIALGGPGLQRFDASAFGTSVEDLRAKQLANQTSAFALQQGQDRRSALEEYSRQQNAGNPNAINALNTQPEAMNTIVTARSAMSAAERTQFDHVLGSRARAANAVAQYPAGSPERLKAWNEQLDELLANKAIDSTQYKRLHGTEPSDMLLQQYIAAGLQVPQYMDYAVKKAGVETAGQFTRAVGQALGGGDPGVASPAPTSANERRLIRSESGGNPSTVNEFGFAGTYQFGAPRLSSLGLYQPGPGENLQTWNRTYKSAPSKWSGEFRIPGFPDVKTFADFLANPAAQKRAFDLHRDAMGQEITDNGFDKYIGTKVGGVLITQEGLENMLHLGGVRSTRRTLESDGKDSPADANGKTPLDYARMAPQGTATSEAPARSAGAGSPSFVQRLLPIALAAQAQPGLPESTAKLATTIIDWAKEESKPTELGKNYDDYARDERENGRVPMSRLEFNIKTVGARGTNVNVDTKGESAESVERGKGLAERLNDIAKKGDEAYGQREVIARLGEKLEESGTGADIAFANWARENFGEKIGGIFAGKKKLESAEAASALINFLKPRMRVAGTGASSDKDLDAFARAIPSLLSTTGGRKIVVETLGGIQQALIERGDAATQYQTGELTAAQALQKMRGLPDPFASFRTYQKERDGLAGSPAPTVPRFRSLAEVMQAVEKKEIEPGQAFWVQTENGPMVGTVPEPTAPASSGGGSSGVPLPRPRPGMAPPPEADPFAVPH